MGTVAPCAEVEAEHRLLLRRYAALQARVSALCQAQRAEVLALQAELVRLRARSICDVSRHAWLALAPPPWHAVWVQAQADALWCHTACLPFGRAGANGDTCRRTQQPCAAPTDPVSEPAPPPRPTNAR